MTSAWPWPTFSAESSFGLPSSYFVYCLHQVASLVDGFSFSQLSAYEFLFGPSIDRATGPPGDAFGLVDVHPPIGECAVRMFDIEAVWWLSHQCFSFCEVSSDLTRRTSEAVQCNSATICLSDLPFSNSSAIRGRAGWRGRPEVTAGGWPG